MRRVVVIYHGRCVDGFTAAWCAYQHFRIEGKRKVEFIPASYGDEPPWEQIQDADVYILDFSYPRVKLIDMNEEANALLVLDHHRTAEEDLAGLEFAQFDMERSGAGLAWDHFMQSGRSWAPWVVNYVEDRDLWRFRLPDSREVNAYIGSQEQTFENWDELAQQDLGTARTYGKVLVDRTDRYVRAMSEQARVMKVHGFDVPVVNAPYISISELLNELAKEAEFAVGWSQGAEGRYVYSLRSCDKEQQGDGGEVVTVEAYDVSALAKEHGGGGHRRAAGFRSDYPPDLEFMTPVQRAEYDRRFMRFVAT